MCEARIAYLRNDSHATQPRTALLSCLCSLFIHSFPLTMLVSSTTTTSSTALVDTSKDLCDVSSLLKLFQDDGKLLNDELELDLLSENGIDTTVVLHTIQQDDFPHCIDLCEYDLHEFDLLPDTNKRTCATFSVFPPSSGACAPATTKRRRVSQSEEYIPSMQDLTLPSSATTTASKDEVSEYLQKRLDTLVKKFQSSYASIMESKQQLDQQYHL
jgi:hypothetical protein